MTYLATEKLDLDQILVLTGLSKTDLDNILTVNTKNYKTYLLWQNCAKNANFSQDLSCPLGTIVHISLFQNQYVTNSVNNALATTCSLQIIHADTSVSWPINITDNASDQNLAMGETKMEFDLNYPVLATDSLVFYGTNKTDIRNFCCIVTIKI
jgi:hypothetical protein